jgi:hypothetical protein
VDSGESKPSPPSSSSGTLRNVRPWESVIVRWPATVATFLPLGDSVESSETRATRRAAPPEVGATQRPPSEAENEIARPWSTQAGSSPARGCVVRTSRPLPSARMVRTPRFAAPLT